MQDTQFDKNRIINFTDAVFSIAMTLLVLEISIPAIHSISERGTINILIDLIPNFIGLVVSFFVIALYWISHLRLMKYIEYFDIGLLSLNLLLLLFIVLLPFSTALYVRGEGMTGPFVFYCLNITMLGVVSFFLIRRIFTKFVERSERNDILWTWEQAKNLTATFIWALAAFLAFHTPLLSRVIFILIFVIEVFVNRRFKKKLSSFDE